MEINNDKIIDTLASNMASSVGVLQVQVAKATAAVDALQTENAELRAKLAVYERGDKNDTARIETRNEQKPKVGQDSHRSAK